MRVLVSMTGKVVHALATADQEDTGRTACAPFGRMGARPMRLRFADGEKWPVTCQRCLKATGN